jgi:polyisoprenoid-binding protein YceI
MKLRLSVRLLSSVLLLAAISGNTSEARSWQTLPSATTSKKTEVALVSSATAATLTTVVSYRINPGQSRFMANVGSGGLLWFMGHTHHFAVRDFTGEATLTPGSLAPASLQLIIKAASLEETGKNFTEQQKQIINKEAHNEVLEADKYPEIIFKSTTVTGKTMSDGQYEAKIAGDLSLHGVTRPVEIPTRVTVNGNTLHATGEFSINRSDYKVKTKAIKGGTIRVRNKITFEFDILANKV